MGKRKKDTDNAGVKTSRIKWCDPACPYAAWPDSDAVDGSRTCRTFIALYCKKLKKLVTKNSPCSVKFGSRRPKSNW
ncbi:MAG: hypothetical protein ABIJ15_06830 [bacterium]